jgi:hypothetical protein
MMIVPPQQRQLGGTRCRFKHNFSSSIRGNSWALTFGNKWGTFFFTMLRHKSMKPSVWVQIDPDDEILEGDSVSQRVGNYLPDSRWRKRYRPTDWPVLKLWRRSAVAALPWECQSKPVASSGARSDGSHQSRSSYQPCRGTVVCARCGRTASTFAQPNLRS